MIKSITFLLTVFIIIIFEKNLFAIDCSYSQYYLQRQDVLNAQWDALDHYNNYGKNEGMCKPIFCTPEDYYKKRQDVFHAGWDAVDHYNTYGKNEGMCHPIKSASNLIVTSVGSSLEDGFFVLKSFNQTLFGGAFGYYNRQKVFTYSNNRMLPVNPGIIVGESVCALEKFNGMLYANTEDSGKVFRTHDGYNWQLVFTGKYTVGCGLAVFGNYLYAVNANFVSPAGHIYRTSNGTNWEKVYDSGSITRYLREIVSYNNKLYAFYKTGVLVSSDGTNWNSMSTPARMFRGHVFNNKLLLAGAREYSATNESSIWSFDGANFKQLYSTPTMSHIGNIHSQGNNLLAITTVNWKGREGGASLLESCDGGNNWRTIHIFNETEGWAIEEHQGNMFVGTKQDGGGGQVYKVTGLCK